MTPFRTRFMFLIVVGCFTSGILAHDFKTNDGKEYKGVTISRVEPDGIVVVTKSGVSKIYFTELPPVVQQRFHYNAQEAASYTADQNQKLAALAQQSQAEAQSRAAEREAYWSQRSKSSPSQNRPSNGGADRQSEVFENPVRESGPRNCYMEVRNVLSALEIQRHWETSWGSYDRDHFGRLVLNIRLGTVGRVGGPMKLRWFWIGRKLTDFQRRIVYGKGEKTVMVPTAYFAECYAAAPILKSHILNLAALGEQYVSGAQHDGWIVCASDASGHLMAEKASSESLLSIFNDSQQFSKLLSEK